MTTSRCQDRNRGSLVFIGAQSRCPRIADFINDGGSVFVTGDSAELSVDHVRTSSRVRSMRAWFARRRRRFEHCSRRTQELARGRNRARQSYVQPATTTSWHFDDRSDDLRSRYKSSGSARSHPILQGAPGPLSASPIICTKERCSSPGRLTPMH